MKTSLFSSALAVVTTTAPLAWAEYDLPTDRRIPWRAGSDLWNGGALPAYPGSPCGGLRADGASDGTAAINTCIQAAAAKTAVVLPEGTILVRGVIRLKSDVVLRGAGASRTRLIGAPRIETGGASVSPPLTYKTLVRGYRLSGAPKKGDEQVTLQGAGDAAAGDWIGVYSDDDPALVTAEGVDGRCDWCGENSGYHLLQQLVQVTAKSGSTITLSRPLYYTQHTNPEFKRYTFGVARAGVEDLKLEGTLDLGADSFIRLDGALFSWVKGVETQNSGSNSNAAHVRLSWSYGCEVRDSYFHGGRSSASGANYGVATFNVNSDHKIENNVLRHNRHSFSFDGGGSGSAYLFNYVDDNFTDDTSYLGSARFGHGGHPYMNLFEGNIVSHITADNYWGSSSHIVAFRNWIWGDESGSGVPAVPTTGFVAIDVWDLNRYYAFVGNVLGVTGKHTSWANASLRPTSLAAYASASAPVVYGYDPAVSGTSLNHGNYDHKTRGVAFWEGGADHTLKPSLYYAARPAGWWCEETPWPPVGPDLTPVASDVPAKRRYDGVPCTPSRAAGPADGAGPGGPGPDGGVADAGAAGATPDGATDSGCACSLGGRSDGALAWLVGLAVGALAALRLRRR